MDEKAGVTDSSGADRRRGRMDFTIEDLPADDALTRRFSIVPDPRRYDRIDRDGEPAYLDKYLRHVFPERVMLEQAARQLRGLPIYHLSASIKSAPAYAASRKVALESELGGAAYAPPQERAAPHERPQSDPTPRELVFLSVDICGGSVLRRAGQAKFDRAYAVFMRELGTVVSQFNGTVYKATGDGFIAYIDHASFTSRSDQAIDLGLTVLRVLRNAINPALRTAGLPELNIRVGADCGPISFRPIAVPATGFSDIEIASDALNRAVKIQEAAGSDQFWIGRDLYELIHVQWLERATEVPFEGAALGVPGYRVYRMD